MNEAYLAHLNVIIATESIETRECATAQAIVRYEANLRRFNASLDRLVAGQEIINEYRFTPLMVSDRLRKKLKL